jgi:hypothetical protein
MTKKSMLKKMDKNLKFISINIIMKDYQYFLLIVFYLKHIFQFL